MFNVGDRVMLTQEYIDWSLSKESIEGYYVGAVLSDENRTDLLAMLRPMIRLKLKNDIPAQVVRLNWPGSSVNYKLDIQGYITNVSPEHVEPLAYGI